jgi:D-alanyl-D-alanine carboxypeptidase
MSFSKNPDTLRVPASITKVMTALLARDWVNDVDLDDAVTVTADDNPFGPGAGGVALGDIVTYRDLFYLMLMTSRDDATHCLARNVGGLIVADNPGGGSSDPYTRFIEQMNVKASVLGLTGAVYYDAGGASASNQMSPNQIEYLTFLLSEDDFLRTAAGTFSRPVTTLNTTPRTFDCVNIFDPTGLTQPDPRVVTGYAFPEHILSKYGITNEAGYCLTLVWAMPVTGEQKVTVVMGCVDDTALKRDLRTLINYEIALQQNQVSHPIQMKE